MYLTLGARDAGAATARIGMRRQSLPARTNTFDPSRPNLTPVGYQPVGMKPRTRESPGREMSMTATALLSALAASSVFPSGETSSAFGVLPAGA